MSLTSTIHRWAANSMAKDIIVKTFEYKIRTTKKFIQAAEKALDDSRFVYNCALEQRIDYYRKTGKTMTLFQQSKEMTAARAELGWIRGCHRLIQENALIRLDRTYKRFFSQVEAGIPAGSPRFKTRSQYRTFGQQVGLQTHYTLTGDMLTIPGVARVRIRLSRPTEGIIKQIGVTKRADGWYTQLTCDIPKPQALPPTGETVGIDVGLKSFITLSTGETIPNPKHLERQEERIKRIEKQIFRKPRGSSNRNKAVATLTAVKRTIARCRKDFNHKLSTNLVKRFDSISVEALLIKNMMRHPTLSKSITDAGWGQFFRMTAYKALNAGRLFIQKTPHYTSQTCSSCGARQSIKLRVRTFKCHCGLILDRDHNAAINIRQGMPKFTPAERLSGASKQEQAPPDVNRTSSSQRIIDYP